jgi:hypothetical protein
MGFFRDRQMHDKSKSSSVIHICLYLPLLHKRYYYVYIF